MNDQHQGLKHTTVGCLGGILGASSGAVIGFLIVFAIWQRGAAQHQKQAATHPDPLGRDVERVVAGIVFFASPLAGFVGASVGGIAGAILGATAAVAISTRAIHVTARLPENANDS